MLDIKKETLGEGLSVQCESRKKAAGPGRGGAGKKGAERGQPYYPMMSRLKRGG